jgi:hypothetical protein
MERSIIQMEGELEGTREEIESKRQAQESVSRRLIELETTREVQAKMVMAAL